MPQVENPTCCKADVSRCYEKLRYLISKYAPSLEDANAHDNQAIGMSGGEGGKKITKAWIARNVFGLHNGNVLRQDHCSFGYSDASSMQTDQF